MRLLPLALLIGALASPLAAQVPLTDKFTVTLKPQRYRICNERPERPEWADQLPVRQAWKGLTLRGIYELRAWENIIRLQDCSCAVRFPGWEVAEQEYTENFIHLEQAEQTALRREWRRQQNVLSDAVRAVCEAQGNW